MLPNCCFKVHWVYFPSAALKAPSPHISAPELVWKKNKFLNFIITDRALSYTAVVHAFKPSSLPALGWIFPIMPWGYHSSPWQSSPLNHPTFIPSSFHHKPHQDLLARWYSVFVNIPVLSGTDIACCHLHRRDSRQCSVHRMVLLHRGGSPCLWGGWARPQEECVDLHAFHGRPVIVKLLSALTARLYHCVLSEKGTEKMSTQSCSVCICSHVDSDWFDCFFTLGKTCKKSSHFWILLHLAKFVIFFPHIILCWL